MSEILGSYFFQPSSGETNLIPLGKIYNIQVSPDGTRYAGVDEEDGKIKVFSAQGEPLAILKEGEQPYAIDRWLDNQRILLAIMKIMEADGHFWVEIPQDEVVIDILTGKEQFLSSDYPGIDDVTPQIGEEGSY